MKVTAYNVYSTKLENCRVVATYDVEINNVTEAMDQIKYRSLLWNKDEDRDNMKVNFICVNGFIRTI